MASSGYLLAIARSLSRGHPCRFLWDSLVSGFYLTLKCPVSNSPFQYSSHYNHLPTWWLMFPSPPALSPLTKSLLCPPSNEIQAFPYETYLFLFELSVVKSLKWLHQFHLRSICLNYFFHQFTLRTWMMTISDNKLCFLVGVSKTVNPVFTFIVLV